MITDAITVYKPVKRRLTPSIIKFIKPFIKPQIASHIPPKKSHIPCQAFSQLPENIPVIKSIRPPKVFNIPLITSPIKVTTVSKTPWILRKTVSKTGPKVSLIKLTRGDK